MLWSGAWNQNYFHNDNKTPVAIISVGICTDDALISFGKQTRNHWHIDIYQKSGMKL